MLYAPKIHKILIVFIFAFTLIFTHSTYSQESVSTEQSQGYTTPIDNPATKNPSFIVCDCASQKKIPCMQITETICQNLWSSKNKGKLEHQDDLIVEGDSRIEGLGYSKLADLEATIASASKLPADIKTAITPHLKELKGLIGNTKIADIAFTTKLSRIEAAISEAIGDVTFQRLKKQNPELIRKNVSEYTVEEKAKLSDLHRSISDEIFLAKNKDSANWKRVERLFEETRRHVLATIEELPVTSITSEKRKWMRDRIKSIKLVYPLQSLDKANASANCQKTETNAYYSRDWHHFTVCAGWFNRYQTDSIISSVIAHEIGHSIDQNSYAASEWTKDPIEVALRPLGNGEYLPCDKWKALLKEAGEPDVISDKSSFPLDKLNRCVAPQIGLNEFNRDTIGRVASASIRNYVSNNVGNELPVLLAQRTIKKYDKEELNPAYMNPQWIQAMGNNSMFSPPKSENWYTSESIVQSLKCQGFETSSRDKQIPMIDVALTELRVLATRRLENYNEVHGRNASGLVNSNLAVEGGEAFSDWIASRAVEKAVTGIEGLTERREYVAKSIAWNCPKPSEVASGEDFQREARKHSTAQHPPDSIRRFSRFSPGLARLLNCEMPKDIRAFGGCEP